MNRSVAAEPCLSTGPRATSTLDQHYGYQWGWILPERVASCAREMQCVRELYGMAALHNLATRHEIDDIPLGEIIEKIRSVFEEFGPKSFICLFVAISIATTKWFSMLCRQQMVPPRIHQAHFGLRGLVRNRFQLTSDTAFFSPNVFVDISDFSKKR